MAFRIFPTTSEAATRATGDGFNSVSPTKKDKYDDVSYHNA